MKTVPRLVVTSLCYAAALSLATADSPPTSFDPDLNSPTQVDAEGIPLSITHPAEKQATEATPDDEDKQAKASANENWLLQNYEKLRANSSSPGERAGVDLYYRVSAEQNATKTAGAPATELTASDRSALFRTGETASSKTALTLRSDPSRTATPLPLSITSFKPLITPFGAAEAAGLHNFYAAPATVPATPTSEANNDPAALETPGMVAAENDPLGDKAALDFSLQLPEASSPDNAPPLLGLPPTNAERIQKLTDSALAIPGQIKTVHAVPASALQFKLPAEPPAPVVIAPSPIRQPIGDPHDIFFR